MKKLFAWIITAVLLLAVNVGAVGRYSFVVTLLSGDITGETYQVYFMGCSGHEENGVITLYITNTSKTEAEFQLVIGYNGSKVDTTAETGFVVLKPGVTGRFVVDDYKNYPEKANDDLGYVPNSQLSGRSVVRVQVKGLKENDTFVVSGLDGYGSVRDSGYNEMDAGAIERQLLATQYITQSKLVIKDESTFEEEEETEPVERTMEQPEMGDVHKFLIFTVSSAIVCVGGIIIYVFSYISKRRNQSD